MGLLDKVKSKTSEMVANITSLSQTENDGTSGTESVAPEIVALSRRAAAQGAVLLKNNGVLPLEKGTRVSLFSRIQRDWFFVGYGSGKI